MFVKKAIIHALKRRVAWTLAPQEQAWILAPQECVPLSQKREAPSSLARFALRWICDVPGRVIGSKSLSKMTHKWSCNSSLILYTVSSTTVISLPSGCRVERIEHNHSLFLFIRSHRILILQWREYSMSMLRHISHSSYSLSHTQYIM
jgi:hypothetical protein